MYVDSILKGLNIMKEILGFHLNGCPYCANAFRAIDELVAEILHTQIFISTGLKIKMLMSSSKLTHMNTIRTYGSTSTNNTRHNLVKAMPKQNL